MRAFIIIISILFSQAAPACYAPRSGQEFDDLLKLEKISGLNRYRVTAPRRLEDLSDAEITLEYVERDDKGALVYESSEKLSPSYTSSFASAEFTVERKGEGKPYISVRWSPKECCPCDIYAYSKYINIE